MDLANVQSIIVETIKETGQLVLEGFYGDKRVKTKGTDIDIVTEYDQMAEDKISAVIKQNFPDHRIMGEEGGELTGNDSPYIWYVDPIDGTTNYAKGFPYFCISIALYSNETPLLGVIYDPTRDELFSAITGRGAYSQVGHHPPQQLRTSQTEKLREALIASGFPYDRRTSQLNNFEQSANMLLEIRGLRRGGSAALDLAYVAAGRLDGYWEYKLNSWDVGAGILLIQEAGGRVIDLSNGQPLSIQPQMSLLASNHHLTIQAWQILEPFSHLVDTA